MFLGAQKTPIGTRDFLFFRLAGCGLRIAFAKTGKAYSVNEEPSATYSYSVNVHVATQLCADPTLPSVFGSGKSSKSSYSKTLYSASRRRGIRYKLFGVNFGMPSTQTPGYSRGIPGALSNAGHARRRACSCARRRIHAHNCANVHKPQDS